MAFLPEGMLMDSVKNKSALENIYSLCEAAQTRQILEARAVVCDIHHNLIVDLNGIKGIIKRNEGAMGIAEGTTRDIALISRVNKPVCFVITGFEKDENDKDVVILSRKKAQEICRREYIDTLKTGDIIQARVTHLEAFGCFVDIACGIVSLIPIDAISVSRIPHSRDRFKVGQNILAVVKSIDEEGKINLTHKELLGTWNENAGCFTVGETVAGIIRSIESYGIFVELAPNLAGLAEFKEDVQAGQHASVYIKSIIPEKMKVKLFIIDAFDDNNDEPYQYDYRKTSGCIDKWRYSPDESGRIIETVFE